jgi:hypothetical protein
MGHLGTKKEKKKEFKGMRIIPKHFVYFPVYDFVIQRKSTTALAN